MDLVSIEAPPDGVAPTGESLELGNTALDVVAARNRLQIIANQLVQAFAHRVGTLSGLRQELLVNRKREVH
ncbi:MAG TPA: hypothetical protein VGS78_17610 [Candidatus Sulfotelmatobacter sp.]|nr:hypothetical protein [Candidatus Sulfotelmatobacter sp.]